MRTRGPTTPLDDKQRQRIYALVEQGLTTRIIADRFGVSPERVRDVHREVRDGRRNGVARIS